MGEHHAVQGGIENGADRPHDETQNPTDPRHPEVETRESVEEAVEGIAVEDELGGDLLRHVHPAPHRHRVLSEVPELVSEDRLEFGEAQDIHESESDLEVLAVGEEKVEQGQLVEDARVDLRGEEDAVGPRGIGVVCEAVQELKEARLVRGGDLEALGPLDALPEEKSLQHENRQKGGAKSRSECRQDRRRHRIPSRVDARTTRKTTP